MSSCGASGASGCGPSDFGQCDTLAEMVTLFLTERRDNPARQAAWWGDRTLSFAQACRRAMFTLEHEGVRDGHQWVYRSADLEAMGRRLAENEAALVGLPTFDGLYGQIERALGVSKNGKPLLIYDIAHRLGLRFGLSPERVFLHAGPKKGADALKRGLGRSRTRALAEFPTSIRTRLTPAQAEDFLCLAANHLHEGLWD